MNYGWLTPSTRTSEYQRVVLHEFGHALGHDSRAPEPGRARPDPVGQAEGLRVLRAAGLVAGRRRLQPLRGLRRGQTNFSDFDPTSIMHYAIPDELTIGSFASAGTPSSRATDL